MMVPSLLPRRAVLVCATLFASYLMSPDVQSQDSPELSLVCDAMPAPVDPNRGTLVTIFYENSSASTASSPLVVVSDYDETAGSVSAITGGGVDDGNTITWNLGSIPVSSGQQSLEYVFTLDANVPFGTAGASIVSSSIDSSGILIEQPTLSPTCEVVALPVELARFKVHLDEGQAFLEWETVSERENAGFFVEHATRDGQFEERGFVEGAGTTSEPRRYRFALNEMIPGRHRFRLRQVDFDGTMSYSPVVEALAELPEAFILEEAYPNPFNPQTTIRFLVAESLPVRVELYDAVGHRVRTLYSGTPAANLTQNVRLNAEALPSGIYTVRLIGRTFTGTQQIVLAK